MRNPGGYAIGTSPDATTVETDTFTCVHCNSVVFVPPKSDVGGFCPQCGSNICERPECNQGCVPFMKKIERAEEAQIQRDQLMRAMG